MRVLCLGWCASQRRLDRRSYGLTKTLLGPVLTEVDQLPGDLFVIWNLRTVPQSSGSKRVHPGSRDSESGKRQELLPTLAQSTGRLGFDPEVRLQNACRAQEKVSHIERVA